MFGTSPWARAIIAEIILRARCISFLCTSRVGFLRRVLSCSLKWVCRGDEGNGMENVPRCHRIAMLLSTWCLFGICNATGHLRGMNSGGRRGPVREKFQTRDLRLISSFVRGRGSALLNALCSLRNDDVLAPKCAIRLASARFTNIGRSMCNKQQQQHSATLS